MTRRSAYTGIPVLRRGDAFALMGLLACFTAACGGIEDGGTRFVIEYKVSLADGVSVGDATGIGVLFLYDEFITEGFPPEVGHAWYPEQLDLLGAGMDRSLHLGFQSRRSKHWRGYARLTPPRGDATPIVGDIVDAVYDEDRCDGDVCYRADADFVLGRVTVP